VAGQWGFVYGCSRRGAQVVLAWVPRVGNMC
jgi:hypothetical protein